MRGVDDEILQLDSEQDFPLLLVDSSDEEEVKPVPKPFVTNGGDCSGGCCGFRRSGRKRGETRFVEFGFEEEEEVKMIKPVKNARREGRRRDVYGIDVPGGGCQ